MTCSVDPDQTDPSGAVWSRSALFAQAHPSQYLEFYGSIHFLLCCLTNITKEVILSLLSINNIAEPQVS